MKLNSLRLKDLNHYKTEKFFIYIFIGNQWQSCAVCYTLKDLKLNFGEYEVKDIKHHYTSVTLILEKTNESNFNINSFTAVS